MYVYSYMYVGMYFIYACVYANVYTYVFTYFSMYISTYVLYVHTRLYSYKGGKSKCLFFFHSFFTIYRSKNAF